MDLAARQEFAYRYLVEAATSLSSALGVDELVDRILAASRDVMQCRACSIGLPDETTGDLLLRGTQPELRGRTLRVPSGKGIAGRVWRTRRAENTADAQTDAEHYRPTGTDLPAAAMLTIPVMDGTTCHGIMQALNPAGRARFDGFDEEVFWAFGGLAAVTLTRLRAQEAENRKSAEEAYRAAELSVAHRVQASFMPAPEHAGRGLALQVRQRQASGVGGDFYTYYDLPDGAFLAAVGDACGKGVPAALEAARVCTLLDAMAPSCSFLGLAGWCAELNARLWATADRAGSLTTLALLAVDAERRWLRAGLFGQEPPRYLAAGPGGWRPLPCHVHPPLGTSRDEEVKTRTVPFGLARAWLLLTDGYAEGRNASGESFGDGRLQETLASAGANDILARLEEDWLGFTAGGFEPDDATALVLTPGRVPPPANLVLELRPERLAEARDWCHGWAEAAGFAESNVYELVLACDELLTNLHKHAFHGAQGNVSLQAELTPMALGFRFSHRGDGLSQEDYERHRARSPASPDPERPGGYGLGFIARVFGTVRFDAGPAGSTIRVVRALVTPG